VAPRRRRRTRRRARRTNAAVQRSTQATDALTHPQRPAPPHARSAQKQERAAAAISAGVVSGVGAMLAQPLVAEAAVTPSLQ
jgi:hypothetical protein